MKRHLFLFLVLLSCSFVKSQDKALEVIYDAGYVKNAIVNDKKGFDRMVLICDNKHSEFYSLYIATRNHIKDSLQSKGIDPQAIRDALRNYPKSEQTYHVYKDYLEKGKTICTEVIIEDYYKYSEVTEKPVWNLGNETKNVLGYSCQKAETTFRGRHWTAWFTSKIPLTTGPWKLWGLPGLILEANTADSLFRFTAVGIKEAKEVTIALPLRKYISCTRKEFKKLKDLQVNDPLGFIQRQFGVTTILEDADRKNTEKQKREAKGYIGLEADI